MITEVSYSCDNRNSYVPYSDTHSDYLYSSDEPMTLDEWEDGLDAMPNFGGGIRHPRFPYSYSVVLVDRSGNRVLSDTSAYAAVHRTQEFLD